MNILKQIKWAIQRAVRGYDDTIYWDFAGYLETNMLEPLEEFCKGQMFLDGVIAKGYNIKRVEVYKTTLELIKDFKDKDYSDQFEEPNSSSRLWEYVGKNINYYWD